MENIYAIIVFFLLILAVCDLFVGVSNDAVNFINSAVGARVARLKTILIVASAGVLLGSVLSSGMMDVARHGVMHPSYFSLKEVMVVFLAVMVTDVVVIDIFNSKGLPTSTTVSMVFELLGATFVSAILKTRTDSTLSLGMLMNGSKASNMIIAIFVSVAIAFISGFLIQWIMRLILTFYYKNRINRIIGFFGGMAFSALSYFIIVKGLGKSPLVSGYIGIWLNENRTILTLAIFVFSYLISQLLHIFGVDVLKLIVLSGTFSLALAFAGNDLVNFIGVPLAALDSLADFVHNGNGDVSSFMMTSMEESAKSPFIYLIIAGIIMIVAITTSKKAHNVVKTELTLSQQSTENTAMRSNCIARWIVLICEKIGNGVQRLIPIPVPNWIDNRFNQDNIILNEGAAYDELRAAVNIVLAASLITIGTTYKLPLSTTYVTFMVAMGSSLADRAWGKDSAAYRVTGMLRVIGGWFLTAMGAFAAASVVALLMHLGGLVIMMASLFVVLCLLWKNRRKSVGYASKD